VLQAVLFQIHRKKLGLRGLNFLMPKNLQSHHRLVDQGLVLKERKRLQQAPKESQEKMKMLIVTVNRRVKKSQWT
jgi:hypothetical protein